MADYLRDATGLDIDRQVKTGSKDRGDLRGVVVHTGGRVAVECKNTAKPVIGIALREVEVERLNLEAVAGVVIAKRHGKGQPEDQLVIMRAQDFAAILRGHRPV